jgi:hypothetical protein
MTLERCREWRERLGAYVLGQLPEDEWATTRAHIEGCAACRAEAESLAPLAELLSKADPAQLATAPAPPARLADRIAATIAGEAERRRRRRRRRLVIGLSGASATVATAAVLLAVVLSPSGPQSTGSQTVTFHSLPRGVQIAAALRPRPYGTEIRMQVSGVRSGTLCRVFLRRADGTAISAGSFRYRYSSEEQASLTSALDLSAARAVGVRAGGRVFVAPLRRGVGAETSADPEASKEEYS